MHFQRYFEGVSAGQLHGVVSRILSAWAKALRLAFSADKTKWIMLKGTYQPRFEMVW